MKPKHLFIALFLGLVAFAATTRWQHTEDSLIMSDGQGYYAYLPAIFIYHDLSLQFVWGINEKYYPGEKAALYVNNTPFGPINKYFVGTAIMQAPFFLLGHAAAMLMGKVADGYSEPYQIGIGLAGIFYACLGLWFLAAFLVRQGFTEGWSVLTGLIVFFGTNLFFYTVYEPSMSHVYSFCTVSAFLFYTSKALQTANDSRLTGSAVALGLTTLIRPINALVLLSVPMVLGSWAQFMESFKSLFQDKKQIVLALLLGLLVISVQPLIYYYQIGRPFIWPYGEEGFNFLSPEIANVLFSYRRGLFVYAPVLFLGVIGFVIGIRSNAFKHIWALGFLSLVTWIISSWWMWFYGGSFGHRAFIEFIPFFSLGIACLVQESGRIAKRWVLLTAVLLCGLQLFQTYQYRQQILPYDGITKEKYWDLFLRTGEDLRWYYTPTRGDDTYTATDSTVLKHTMETELGWGNEHQLSEECVYTGAKSSKMSGADQYGISLRYNVAECDHRINTIRIGGQISSNLQTTDLAYVCSVEDSAGVSKYWSSRVLRPQFPWFRTWGKANALFTLPFPCDPTDRIVIFPFKSDDATVYLDDFEITLLQVKDN